jgi:mitotic spindle assembly checkpoint protein MAD1
VLAQSKLEADLRTTRTELRALREEHDELGAGHHTLSHSSSHIISTQKTQLTTLAQQVSVLERERADAEALAAAQARSLAELQEEADELRARTRELSRAEGETQSWTVVRAELARQTGYVRKLEAANARMGAELSALKERNARVEVLQEQKRDLERKLEGMQELRERLVRMEGELEAAR